MGYVTCTAKDQFFGNDEGKVVAGQRVALEESYARELEAKGLVTIYKAMPEPQNKMAPEPRNKRA